MIAKIVVLLATIAVAMATPTCKCGRSSKPVCGTDAHTYENECLLMCAGLTNSYIKLEHEGPCKPQHPVPPSPCGICTLIYMPLCGSDGRTYSNECEFKCARSMKANLEKISDGPCSNNEKVQVVEGEKVQVVEGEKVQVVEGEKVQIAEGNLFQNCMCVRNYKPVCGTDGRTYNNECVLGCNRANNKNLQVARVGPCETVQVVENSQTEGSISLVNRGCICGRNLKPVCGSDGNTYANTCKLNCARVDNPLLRVSRVGPCDDTVRVVN